MEGRVLSKVLLLPPDLTRLHSYAGKITALYYDLLKDKCQVDIMPALGTHDAMTKEECLEFLGPMYHTNPLFLTSGEPIL